jgi:superfamily II DNA or RNA helicase
MLRDYQIEMLDRLERAWQGHRSVLVQMPTGTGKTVLLAEVVRGQMKLVDAPSVLIVAHRRELIEQIRNTLKRYGLDGANVVVESIQKLSSPTSQLSPVNYQLVIVDEAHHALAKTYRTLWERWPEAKFLGLTATPCRLSGEAFTDLFEVLLQSWTIQTFIDKGWLSDFEYVSAAPDNRMMQQVRGLRKRGLGGDYQEKEMCAVLDVPESIEHLYKTYKSFADGKKGIVYAINQRHARHIDAYYREQGVNCCVIDSRTPARERQRMVEDYRNGRIDVLVNVDIFSNGFDCPEVEFIQLARPTLSLSLYLQQVGRGMRISQGKEAVMILDQVGMYQTFGLPTDEHDWGQAFLGKLAGKGNPSEVRGIVVRDDMDDKELVNLEMVRIKRSGEAHRNVEVFIQNGKYGIMFDGKVTCPAQFERIRRLSDGYFALATYPYLIYRNKVTVIDRQGRDLKASLYGKVKQEGDLFHGQSSEGKMTYWDGKGRTYYDAPPAFERVGNLDMVRTGKNQYQLRRPSTLMPRPVCKKDIFYNDKLTVINDIVILNDDNHTVLKPSCYFGDRMLVEARRNGHRSFRWVTLADGLTDEYTDDLYWEGSTEPLWKDTRMVNAGTGKLEYMSPEWGVES